MMTVSGACGGLLTAASRYDRDERDDVDVAAVCCRFLSLWELASRGWRLRLPLPLIGPGRSRVCCSLNCGGVSVWVALPRLFRRLITCWNCSSFESGIVCVPMPELCSTWISEFASLSTVMIASLTWSLRLSNWACVRVTSLWASVILSHADVLLAYLRMPVCFDSSLRKLSFSRLSFLIAAFWVWSSFKWFSISLSNRAIWFWSRVLVSDNSRNCRLISVTLSSLLLSMTWWRLSSFLFGVDELLYCDLNPQESCDSLATICDWLPCGLGMGVGGASNSSKLRSAIMKLSRILGCFWVSFVVFFDLLFEPFFGLRLASFFCMLVPARVPAATWRVRMLPGPAVAPQQWHSGQAVA